MKDLKRDFNANISPVLHRHAGHLTPGEIRRLKARSAARRRAKAAKLVAKAEDEERRRRSRAIGERLAGRLFA